MVTTFALFLITLFVLMAGAELLVKGSSQLAAGLGVPPLIIGLTIVAYGTSSPEVVVGIVSSLKGQTDIALGNVVGSNTLNVLFILGTAAIISPLAVHQQLIRIDVPIMIAVSLLTWALTLSGTLSFASGVLLLLLLVAYTALMIWLAKRNNNAEDFVEEYRINGQLSQKMIVKDLIFVVCGIALLAFATDPFVESAVAIAAWAGVSELVISLTVIALGTSMPEFITSLSAVARGKTDIAVGNIVGTSIFNLCGVLGLSVVVAKEPFIVPASVIWFDLPIMNAVAAACLPLFFTGYTISRLEGCLFVTCYAAYVYYLIG